MSAIHSNQFALLNHEESDSDDSVYVEGGVDASTGPLVDPVVLVDSASAQAVLLSVNPEGWDLVRRRDTAETRAPDHTSCATPWDCTRVGNSLLIPPGNWREHNRENIIQHRRQTGVQPATSSSGRDENLGHRSKTGQVRSNEAWRNETWRNEAWRANQTEGTIVRHVDLHYFPAGEAPQDQGPVVDLLNGGQVLPKDRLFLIVGLAGNRIIECPIFTYGGTGLLKQHKTTWPEYCSIRPLHIPVESFENQSPKNMVLDVEWQGCDWQVKKSSVVRLSDVRCQRHTGTGVVVVATISPDALQYAVKKLADLMSEAVMPAKQ